MAETAKKMNIYEAISRCMEEIGAVGKDAVNKQQGFKYRGIDAVMNAINPALPPPHALPLPSQDVLPLLLWTPPVHTLSSV